MPKKRMQREYIIRQPSKKEMLELLSDEDLRKQLGYSQERFANQILNITYSTYHR
jgi:DNA-binding transcriptional regulator YiaG